MSGTGRWVRWRGVRDGGVDVGCLLRRCGHGRRRCRLDRLWRARKVLAVDRVGWACRQVLRWGARRDVHDREVDMGGRMGAVVGVVMCGVDGCARVSRSWRRSGGLVIRRRAAGRVHGSQGRRAGAVE